MKVGSQITVRAHDLSGRLARVWPVTVERVIDGGVVVYSTSSNSPAGTPGWSMWTSFTRPWSGMGFRQSFRPHVSGR